jgi:CheY-like chemotaxis protein
LLKKILVVDDSAAIHHIYQMTLSRYKCPVLSALHGKEGLNKLILNPDINLLIVDMHMPHMSGADFIIHVKEQEAFRNIPIIAVISRGENDSHEANQLAEGILKKPFTSREIHLEIERLFPQTVLEPIAI